MSLSSRASSSSSSSLNEADPHSHIRRSPHHARFSDEEYDSPPSPIGGPGYQGVAASGRVRSPGRRERNNNAQSDVVRPPRQRRVHRELDPEGWWSIEGGAPLSMGLLEGMGGEEGDHRMLFEGVVDGERRERREVWDLSDAVAELYDYEHRAETAAAIRVQGGLTRVRRLDASVGARAWLAGDPGNGYIRVYAPSTRDGTPSELVACTHTSTAHKVCQQIVAASLHVQLSGGVVRRMDPSELPLTIQNDWLAALGYTDVERIQGEGGREDLAPLVKFYSGKPMHDSTFTRRQIQAQVDVKKGGLLQQWVRRVCILSGTRLLVYKDKLKKDEPSIIQLARGLVEEVKVKGHDLCLKLTATLVGGGGGDKQIYLSFIETKDYARWLRRCRRATDRLPTTADLSNCHLEYLPEMMFINDQLCVLSARQNRLRERVGEEDLSTIGWIEDLTRFHSLRSLNLSDNDLRTFPLTLCCISTLVELNLATNRLEDIPSDIHLLHNLQALHLHNNHLTSVPDELLSLRKLFILVLAFNRFASLPPVVAQITNVRYTEAENIVLAGNQIARISSEALVEMKYVKKVDLRLNQLVLPSTETLKFSVLEHLTHLDVRDNRVTELDLRSVRSLEWLNCERNAMVVLQLNGTALKSLFAASNCLERVVVSPKPEWLLQIDVSNNCLESLPEWLSDCFFLQRLNASHNFIQELPTRLFVDARRLRSLRVGYNRLTFIPFAADADSLSLEELHFQYNQISALPPDFLQKANRLRVLNATKNRLSRLPPVSDNPDLNRVQELYLSGNMLSSAALATVAGFPRLRVLHLAANCIADLYDRDVLRLQCVRELNVSSNKLTSLPPSLASLPRLLVLRVHSNALTALPDFSRATALKILDVGHNELVNVSVASLIASSQLNLLDMSLNTQLNFDPKEFRSVKGKKPVCLVDLTGQNRSAPGLVPRSGGEASDVDAGGSSGHLWKVGFAESFGYQSKLCVAMLRMPQFRSDDDGLFAMFDGGCGGGGGDDVPKLLVAALPELLKEEMARVTTPAKYMKYALLAAHRKLGSAGRLNGASAVVCYIRRELATAQMTLDVASVGDTEAVLCRRGEAVSLTCKFVTTCHREECQRVYKSGGWISEDCRVQGSTPCTRQLGSAQLHPHVIPDPHVTSVTLRGDDEFIVVGNAGLWAHVSYEEAIDEVYEVSQPMVAAKRLQDLAHSCRGGSGSSRPLDAVSVLVLRLHSPSAQGARSRVARLEARRIATASPVGRAMDATAGLSAMEGILAAEPPPEYELNQRRESQALNQKHESQALNQRRESQALPALLVNGSPASNSINGAPKAAASPVINSCLGQQGAARVSMVVDGGQVTRQRFLKKSAMTVAEWDARRMSATPSSSSHGSLSSLSVPTPSATPTEERTSMGILSEDGKSRSRVGPSYENHVHSVRAYDGVGLDVRDGDEGISSVKNQYDLQSNNVTASEEVTVGQKTSGAEMLSTFGAMDSSIAAETSATLDNTSNLLAVKDRLGSGTIKTNTSVLPHISSQPISSDISPTAFTYPPIAPPMPSNAQGTFKSTLPSDPYSSSDANASPSTGSEVSSPASQVFSSASVSQVASPTSSDGSVVPRYGATRPNDTAPRPLSLAEVLMANAKVIAARMQNDSKNSDNTELSSVQQGDAQPKVRLSEVQLGVQLRPLIVQSAVRSGLQAGIRPGGILAGARPPGPQLVAQTGTRPAMLSTQQPGMQAGLQPAVKLNFAPANKSTTLGRVQKSSVDPSLISDHRQSTVVSPSPSDDAVFSIQVQDEAKVTSGVTLRGNKKSTADNAERVTARQSMYEAIAKFETLRLPQTHPVEYGLRPKEEILPPLESVGNIRYTETAMINSKEGNFREASIAANLPIPAAPDIDELKPALGQIPSEQKQTFEQSSSEVVTTSNQKSTASADRGRSSQFMANSNQKSTGVIDKKTLPQSSINWNQTQTAAHTNQQPSRVVSNQKLIAAVVNDRLLVMQPSASTGNPSSTENLYSTGHSSSLQVRDKSPQPPSQAILRNIVTLPKAGSNTLSFSPAAASVSTLPKTASGSSHSSDSSTPVASATLGKVSKLSANPHSSAAVTSATLPKSQSSIVPVVSSSVYSAGPMMKATSVPYALNASATSSGTVLSNTQPKVASLSNPASSRPISRSILAKSMLFESQLSPEPSGEPLSPVGPGAPGPVRNAGPGQVRPVGPSGAAGPLGHIKYPGPTGPVRAFGATGASGQGLVRVPGSAGPLKAAGPVVPASESSGATAGPIVAVGRGQAVSKSIPSSGAPSVRWVGSPVETGPNRGTTGSGGPAPGRAGLSPGPRGRTGLSPGPGGRVGVSGGAGADSNLSKDTPDAPVIESERL